MLRASWSDLEAHVERGALFVVAPDLDLVEVGVAVVSDDAAAVEGWVNSEALRRPLPAEIEAWKTGEWGFGTLIAQHFVLVQPGRSA